MAEQEIQKTRKRRFDEGELILIKNTFAENDDLLILIRKVLLQGELTPDENKIIKSLGADAIAIIRKAMLPKLDANAPLFQLADMWMSIETKDKNPEDVFQNMVARQLVVDYFDNMLKILAGEKVEIFRKLDSMVGVLNKYPEVAYVDILARNTIINHIDIQLYQLKLLAGSKKETPEEMMKRLEQDSAK